MCLSGPRLKPDFWYQPPRVEVGWESGVSSFLVLGFSNSYERVPVGH